MIMEYYTKIPSMRLFASFEISNTIFIANFYRKFKQREKKGISTFLKTFLPNI